MSIVENRASRGTEEETPKVGSRRVAYENPGTRIKTIFELDSPSMDTLPEGDRFLLDIIVTKFGVLLDKVIRAYRDELKAAGYTPGGIFFEINRKLTEVDRRVEIEVERGRQIRRREEWK